MMANPIDGIRENLEKAQRAINAAHGLSRFARDQLDGGDQYFGAIEVATGAAGEHVRNAQLALPDELPEPEGQEAAAPLVVTIGELMSYIGAIKEIGLSRRGESEYCATMAAGDNRIGGVHTTEWGAVLVAFVDLIRTWRIADGALVRRDAEADTDGED